jgi:hypothetical protein
MDESGENNRSTTSSGFVNEKTEHREISDGSTSINSDSLENKMNLNALDMIQEFMDDHWMQIRLGCICGSVVFFLASIVNSSAFKRIDNLQSLVRLDRLLERKFRVFIAHIDRDPQTSELNLYAFHTPWLRNLLGIHPSKLSLEKQTWKIRLAGVTFPRGDEISEKLLFERFYRKSFIVRFIKVPDSSSYGNCFVYKSNVIILNCDFRLF